MKAPNPAKRLCQNPNSFPKFPDFNQNRVDQILSSFLSLLDSPLLSASLSDSIGCSLDRVLEKLFEASGDDDSVQERLAARGLQFTSLLSDSTKRCSRKRATLCNFDLWSLPHEITVKVFSKLDTKSLMQASACCTMFNKCDMDPLCYSHIDLTTKDVKDEVVHSMINHAGKELRSLKVGLIPCPDESTGSNHLSELLTGSCLAPLSFNHCFLGNCLESLHLYNHRWLNKKSLLDALSACSNLTDLKIVGFDKNISPIEELLELVPRKCQHLFIEKEIGPVPSVPRYMLCRLWKTAPI